LQFLEGAVVAALAGTDGPLEAIESGDVPEVGIGAAEAAKAPIVVDQGVDGETLEGVGGAEELAVLGFEYGEIRGFGELEFGLGAVLGGVEAGGRAGGMSGGAGGSFGVAADGCALLASGHGTSLFKGSRGGGNFLKFWISKGFGMKELDYFEVL
jgi:hypothetical protein